MDPPRTSRLLAGDLVEVFDVCCDSRRFGFGEHRWAADAQILFPRRGVFLVERRREITAIDTNAVLILASGEPYRFSHPAWGGHDSTIFILSADLVATALGSKHGFHGLLRPNDHLAVHLLRRALASDLHTQLESEEACMLLLQALAAVVPTDRGEVRLGPGQRLRIQRARALLASDPTRSWTLASLAQAMDSSPFHLARQFRLITNETISRYILRLRLAIALQRLSDGESDLMKLACDLGFAHHSHFSARFRSVFKLTPSEVRQALAVAGGRELVISAVGADAYLEAKLIG